MTTLTQIEYWDELQARWTAANDRLQELCKAEDPDDNAVVEADEQVWPIEKLLLEMPAPHTAAIMWKAGRIVEDEVLYPASIVEPFLAECRQFLTA